MKNGHKTNGMVKLQPRDEFVKKHSPIILSALLMRRDSMTSNERVDLAIETTGQIYSAVTTEERRDYLLENVPTVLSAFGPSRLSPPKSGRLSMSSSIRHPAQSGCLT